MIIFAGWAIISHAIFVAYFFGPFNREQDRLLARQVDVKQACDWLRPRMNSVDAVFFTEEDLIIPHDNILLWLNYEPRDWFAGVRAYATGAPPYYRRHVCTRFGKIRVMYHPEESARELDQLADNGKVDHVVMILRPDQIAMARGHRPAQVIGSAQSVWLIIYEFDI